MARAKQSITWAYDEATQVHTFTVGDAGSVTFDPNKASDANRLYAEVHGWKARLGDKAALSRDTTNGKSATDADKLAAIRRAIEHYESGSESWDLPRVGGAGGGRSEASYILQAVAEVQGVDQKTMAERVAAQAEKRGMTPDAYLKAVARQSQAVREAVAAIKYGEAEGGDDMLGELGEADEGEQE